MDPEIEAMAKRAISRQLGDAETKREEDARLAIGKSEATIQRIARSTWAIRQAFGDQYLLDRMDYYCKDRIEDQHREFAEKLVKYKYTGLAGLGDFFNVDDEDLPI